MAGVERIWFDAEADTEQQQGAQLLPFPGKDTKLRVLWHPWRAAELQKVLGFSLLCCSYCGISARLASGVASLDDAPSAALWEELGAHPFGEWWSWHQCCALSSFSPDLPAELCVRSSPKGSAPEVSAVKGSGWVEPVLFCSPLGTSGRWRGPLSALSPHHDHNGLLHICVSCKMQVWSTEVDYSEPIVSPQCHIPLDQSCAIAQRGGSECLGVNIWYSGTACMSWVRSGGDPTQ